MSTVCCAHSPGVPKAGHLLLPENVLGLVCTVPGGALGAPLPHIPSLSPPHRWASLQVKLSPLGGFEKESGHGFLAAMTSSR